MVKSFIIAVNEWMKENTSSLHTSISTLEDVCKSTEAIILEQMRDTFIAMYNSIYNTRDQWKNFTDVFKERRIDPEDGNTYSEIDKKALVLNKELYWIIL